MTIAVAWVRTTKRGAEEVLICADSRLNGGGNLDCSPKIFQLSRGDCGIAFAGTTLIGYPFLLQVSNAISSHMPMRDGVIDYVRFRTYALKLMTKMHREFDAYDPGLKAPDTEFLLGGYSWFNKTFCIDRISYVPARKEFIHAPCRKGVGRFGKVVFIGDVASQGRTKLASILRERYGDESVLPGSKLARKFDMEPFEAVRDLLRSAGRESTIGGPPQILSISQHLHSKHLAVYWPNKPSDRVFVCGRPVFDFENLENWILDPDTLEKEHMYLQKMPSDSLKASGSGEPP